MSSDLYKTETSKSRSNQLGANLILGFFGLVFAGVGVLALVAGVRQLLAGQTNKNAFAPLGIGLVFSLVGTGLIWGLIWAARNSRRLGELAARYPDQPWMLRSDWAAGRIKSSAATPSYIMLIMSIAFLGIGGTSAVLALPRELHHHNYAALLILFFPLAGVGLFIGFLRGWTERLRYGECLLEMAHVPAPLGGVLEGTVQTGGRLKLEHALHLKFCCIRRIVTRSGRNNNVSEYILWQDEKAYGPQAFLSEIRPGHTGIPVYFKLPAEQPESSSSGNMSVEWRLELKSAMAGPNFHALFEVPVFRVAGAEAAAQESDPTASLQMPVEEVRRDEHSLIQVTSGPDGQEFYFPARRNWIRACIATGALLFCGAIFAMMINGPVAIRIFAGIFVVITALGSLDLWFGSIRITVNPEGARVFKRWLFLTRSRQFGAGEIERFQPGLQQDIRLVPNAGRQVQAVGGIADMIEADWLAREMNKALGRRMPADGEQADVQAGVAAAPFFGGGPGGGAATLASPANLKRINRLVSFIFLVIVVATFAPFVMTFRHTKHRPTAPAPAMPAVQPAAQTPAMMTGETRNFSISGTGFTIETLDVGQRAFSNRGYVWVEVPVAFRGRRFTRVSGGGHPHINVQARADTTLQIITSSQGGQDPAGWEKTTSEFSYNDKKNSRMVLLEKKLGAGESIDIPQQYWTGSLVLLPN